jgi:hypothetical protein
MTVHGFYGVCVVKRRVVCSGLTPGPKAEVPSLLCAPELAATARPSASTGRRRPRGPPSCSADDFLMLELVW